ncbi:exodeoxyribonuclease VII large subunit [Hyphomicrobium methylovorum]|uniref:exodeoxyribonuclease VII large subunit n=1 Tax=Hyphomicrobium methylovorum TaxID=84 RepID=UPI0015E76413|nr:exodeoxyribonuclease VII large subunit [Hyphomicrobium methylovorum]MBA2126855.1 exodeoxyribonuclease VII large subunit [Hyphomicrobium methylovorum]
MTDLPQAKDARSGANTPEYSVSELSGAIRRAIEGEFGHVRLRGEISGYRGPHASGHCYFALKDDKAKIDAVIWKGSFGRLRFKPEEGMEVIAQGKLTTFPGSSKYQIVIEAIEPAGAGALMAVLEERKRKLAAEGLFDEARKKPLPFLPKVVGIVTSPTGAVIRDMLHGFNERFPTRVLLWPVRVQGEGSAAEVAAAIRGFNALSADGKVPRPDVLIVARGGGSLEDLWGFNEESVARAVAESDIPLISAVGHETDWTLIDLVADARAPTPTKAAEWAVPKYSDLIERVESFDSRQRTAMRRVLNDVRSHLKASARGLPRLADLIAMPRQRFDAVDGRLSRALLSNTRAHGTRLARTGGRLNGAPLVQKISRLDERLQTLDRRRHRALAQRLVDSRRTLDGRAALLKSLGYQSVLARGFALVRDDAGLMVRSAGSIAPGAALGIEFADGRIGVVADGTPPLDRSGRDPQIDTKPPRPKKGGRGGQGSLF